MADAYSVATRSPLAEAAHRINSPAPHGETNGPYKPRYDTVDPMRGHESTVPRYGGRPPGPPPSQPPASHPAPQPRPRAPRPEAEDDKRFSQASYASTSSSRSKKSYKTHIGPWQLGKTLGQGSSAQVRLCRHTITNQLAAVKIVNRRKAYLVHDSSLAALSKYDSSLPSQSDGQMRVPMAIEREVAILKLIEHPNIMKLYDIWENRSEIYLILEYIDQGDLFTFINSKGRLSEEVSIYFFRQMISAIAYCHSFNVCHRDLKPENILITADLKLKIADFGMAALHQTATHHLATACGSPHYAAPELLKNREYRGDRADIWSMGVILYAMLSATLPFDDPDLRVMMNKTKKGQYDMPRFLSPEAEDLIRRMLQVNPDRRITLNEIWKHPLVQKYSYLDDFGDLTGQLPETRKGFRYAPIPRHEIDPQLLRQLRSMWHMFSDQELMVKLSSEEKNDQKAFYWLLYNYRSKQLEDFKPELAHSMSDYHHLKPSIWKKRVSTVEFTKPRANGHGRSVSKFTVISNVGEDDNETVLSYDPYRASGKLKSMDSQVSHAKVVIHRDEITPNSSASKTRLRSGSNTTRRPRAGSVNRTPHKSHNVRGSVTSLHSIKQGTPGRQAPSLRHKRAVDFSHIRKKSNSMGKFPRPPTRTGSTNAVGAASSTTKLQRQRSVTPEVPKLPDGKYPKANGAPFAKNTSAMFREDIRHFSLDIAKNCDEAFKSTFKSNLTTDESILTDADKKKPESTPVSPSPESPSVSTDATEFSNKSWLQRPLPPLPASGGFENSAETTKSGSRPTSGETELDYVIEGVTRVPVVQARQIDRRIVSAPVVNQTPRKAVPPMPSINENIGAVTTLINNDKTRIVSAPPQTSGKSANEENGGMEYLSKVENTIRVVSSDHTGTAQSAGLSIRKKPTKEEVGKHLQVNTAVATERDMASSTSSDPHSASMKKRSWFRRVSRADTEAGGSETSAPSAGYSPSTSDSQEPESATTDGSKKRSFSLPFWKGNKHRESKMGIEEEPEKEKELEKEQQVMRATSRATSRKSGGSELLESTSGGQRNIEVKQNWLTRLFRVKPATSYICMTLPRRRARQEVAILLREWRRYGIRDIQVDKQRNIIFTKVAAKNYLNIKEVAIAAEVMTVIEHGKRGQMSIVRFTQERGAASSFHRVVDTMRLVFDSRGLLVADRRKQKMMIKTLTAVA